MWWISNCRKVSLMKESLKKAQKAYEQRQKDKGIKIRCFRLTDEEWEKVKEFIKKIRGEI